jgi:hypothetical protein
MQRPAVRGRIDPVYIRVGDVGAGRLSDFPAVRDTTIARNSIGRVAHGMKRRYFPGIIDIVDVTDPQEIRTVSAEPRFDRDFAGYAPVLNRRRVEKMLRAFSVDGKPFPTMVPRTDTSRAAAHDALWSKLNAKAEEVSSGPAELEPLADWVRGNGAAEQIGPLVQQSVGRLFVENFTATPESWAAARMIVEALGSAGVLKILWWRVSGKLERAQTLLASMVNGDLAGVNGIGVALHHVVDGLRKMRQLAADPALRSSLTPDAAADQCLFPASTVLRQAKASGVVGGCPFRRGSLFVLQLVGASKGAANRDIVFLSQSWSRCPAEKWVPALLAGVWIRAQAR